MMLPPLPYLASYELVNSMLCADLKMTVILKDLPGQIFAFIIPRALGRKDISPKSKVPPMLRY